MSFGLSRAALVTALLSSLVMSACGRTPLDRFEDGGFARFDARVDGSMDGATDARTDAPTDMRIDANDGGGFCRTDIQCDDGVFCNGTETCVGGRCAPGQRCRNFTASR